MGRETKLERKWRKGRETKLERMGREEWVGSPCVGCANCSLRFDEYRLLEHFCEGGKKVPLRPSSNCPLRKDAVWPRSWREE